jgi:hypothetical protein
MLPLDGCRAPAPGRGRQRYQGYGNVAMERLINASSSSVAAAKISN